VDRFLFASATNEAPTFHLELTHMKKTILSLLSAICALSGCGPGAKIASGKQAAAEALYAATMPSGAKASQTANPADTLSITFGCPQGGNAELSGFQIASLGVNAMGIDVAQQFTATYKACGLAKSEAGVAVYNGAMTIIQGVKAATSGASVEQKIKGRVSVQGAFDDFLETDVSQSVAVSSLSGSGAVSMVLKGTVTNGSGSYTFDETVNITAGQISAQVTKK
jgi:hypothetical protein